MEASSQKTGIIYCRVSSKDQIENTSLESQERHCREFAKKHDISILDVYVDKGESAKTADRTEFLKAIAFCRNKNNRVDYFIVYKIDRFARNQDDHVLVRATLRRSGTELRSASEPINESPVGRAMEGMISVFAEFDNNVRTERTKGGMLERIKKGVWVWGAPLGYYRPERGNIVPDPKAAPLIRLIFEEWTKGTHSYQTLAKLTARKGLRTRRGKTPCAQLMEKILKNPIYCGIIDMWGEQYKGSFEPIVSEELFSRCNGRYKRMPRFIHRSPSNPEFPLRRLTVCATCHLSLTGSFSTGRKGVRYPYYHHHRQNCPKAQYIPKETFEQDFVEYLESITPDRQYEKLFKAVVLDIWKNNYATLDEENNKLRNAIKRLEDERQRVFDLHRSGTYSNEEFLEQKKRENQLIAEKVRVIQHKHVEEFNMEEALDYCFKFVRNTAATWLRLGPKYDVRLRFQQMIFEKNIRFDGTEFGTTDLSPIYKLNQEFDGQKSTLVALVLKFWNRIVEHLEKWREFAIDLAASDSPQTEIESVQEDVTYEPIKPENGWQEPQVSY